MSIESNHYITIKIKDCDKPNELKERRKLKNCETTNVHRLFKLHGHLKKRHGFTFEKT